MFEIGSSLREARLRRGLDLADVERETKIRRRYLEALEAERFDLFPGGAYARAFLRTYADFLGLKANLYVEEYEGRFPLEEPEPLVPQPTVPPLRRHGIPVAATVALLVVVLAAVVAWERNGRDEAPLSPLPHTQAVVPKTPPAATPVAHPVRKGLAMLVLTARRGDCWLSVRRGSREGPAVFEGFLRRGETRRYALRGRLWIRMGAPWNLDARLGGRRLHDLPARTGNVLVSRSGLSRA